MGLRIVVERLTYIQLPLITKNMDKKNETVNNIGPEVGGVKGSSKTNNKRDLGWIPLAVLAVASAIVFIIANV